MKVLLIRPHVPLATARAFQRFLHLEPLDLEIVAGGIPDGHDISILDLSLFRKPIAELRRRLACYAPDLVGISGYSNQSQIVRDYAQIIKANNADTFVIAGGIHASIAAADYKCPGLIDAVVRGDGAGPIHSIVEALSAGAAIASDPWLLLVDAPQFDELASVIAPAWSSEEVQPQPRRDLVDSSRYFCICPAPAEGGSIKSLFPTIASVRTSLGCPFRCNFCVVRVLTGGRYIKRPPEDVVEELAALEQDYIYFVDDEMFVDADRCRRMAELLIERGIKKKYISWARSDTICANVELFRLWKKAGLELLYIGIESLEEENLDYYNKKTHPDGNLQAVAILRELGIGLHAAMMVNPDFVADDFIKVRHAINKLAPAEITFTVFSPSPGTELYAREQDRLLFANPYLYYDCMHTILPTRLPLKTFYRYFALLYLFAFKRNPWKANGIRVPLRDKARLFADGARCGWILRNLYRDYPKKQW